ncbi:MAG: OmpA family protein [Kamptonema sp. SIO4C4]|nr:OmpA family protein [Kamptonema sp. SIO4C4]
MTQSFDDSFEAAKSNASTSNPQNRLLGCGLSVLLLLISSTITTGLGIILALTNPQPTADKPFLVQVWERWQPNQQPKTPQTPASSTPSPSPTQPDPQQLQQQISSLQQQLTTLREQTNTLEQELAVQPASQDLEARLAALQQKAQQLPSPTPQATPLPTYPRPPLSGQFTFTFAEDLIFNEDGQLSAEGQSLLDNILENIEKNVNQYDGSTIRIAAHTDAADTPAENRELSFQKARMVKQYMMASLPNTLQDRYRWVSIGYGQTSPLASQENENRLGNRRLEIAID